MEKVAHSNLIKTSENSRLDKFKVQSSKFKVSINTLLIIFIIILAGFLRLYRIEDYMTFLGDEGRDVLVAKEIIEGLGSLLSLDIAGVQEKLTLLGPTASVGGFFLGPIYYYFMAPFLWLFNYNPVGPAVMVGVFGVATVWLIYKIGSEFFNSRVGLIAAFLYSISPLVIAHSRSSWNPNLMPFFSLLTLYVVYKAILRNSFKLLIFCGFLLGITMQLHYLALFLGLIVGVYVLATRHLLRKGDALYKKILTILKDYFYILIGFLIGWSPFLAFEARHGFPNIQSIMSFIFNSGDTGSNNHFFSIINNVFFRLFARLITNFPPPEQVSLQERLPIAIWYHGTLTLAFVSFLLLSYYFIKSFYNKNKEQFLKISLLVLWLVIGVGLFGFYKKPIYDYYFGFMFPLPFILVGNTLVALYTNIHEYARYIVGSIFKLQVNRGRHEWTPLRSASPNFAGQARIRLIGKVLATSIFVFLVWINLKGVPFRYAPNRQLAQVEQISKFVINETENKPFNFALITGGNSDHAYRYFFSLWEKQPVTIENPKKDPQRKTVADQLLIVCETPPCHPLGHSLWEIAGFGRAEIVSQWNVSVVKVYKLKHYKGT